jgi:hypothetical protein
MNKKKFAIYVEGQTEQVLINHLIKTWWCYEGIQITNLKILKGLHKESVVKNYPLNSDHEPQILFLIFNVEGEGSLSSSIADRACRQYENHFKIIALRDLYAEDYKKEQHKENVDQVILANIRKALKIKGCAEPEKIDIFFSVMEIESWLLAFSNALLTWAKCSPPLPQNLEAIPRPSIRMGEIGKLAGRGDHKSYHEITSFVTSITHEDIQDVYKSARVPSFSRFWNKILSISGESSLQDLVAVSQHPEDTF